MAKALASCQGMLMSHGLAMNARSPPINGRTSPCHRKIMWKNIFDVEGIKRTCLRGCKVWFVAYMREMAARNSLAFGDFISDVTHARKHAYTTNACSYARHAAERTKTGLQWVCDCVVLIWVRGRQSALVAEPGGLIQGSFSWA